MVLARGQLKLLPLRSLAIFCWVDSSMIHFSLIVVSDRADGASVPPPGTRPPQLRSKSG